ASALGAPLLLASADVVPIAAIRSFGAWDVVLIGGTAALPDHVADRIAAETGASVRRLAGANRYETAAAVAAATAAPDSPTVRVAGATFETALVAAVHAARIGARLLLDADLPPGVVDLDGERLQGRTGALNQALVARFPPTGAATVVTTTSAFPDALSAAALAGARDLAVLFTTAVSATQPSLDLFRLLDPPALIVIGGTAAVPSRILQQLLGFVPLPPEVAPGAEDLIARDLFDRANAERGARGAASLAWDESLAADARGWAREMSRTGYRHATLPNTVGENIHMPIGWCDDTGCHQPTSGLLHRDWMRSGDNRDNLVEPGYVIAGFGVHCAPDGTLWAVARFGVGFEGVSPGGSPATPFVHPGIDGLDCAGIRT
ncbi:MAG TPA: cell wall-binding repeat-containing protein, partial [Acidimicrobiales bacterium]|nr:cell wall-binding repeat-containing protein [Acidimicrobiales bacterium]